MVLRHLLLLLLVGDSALAMLAHRDVLLVRVALAVLLQEVALAWCILQSWVMRPPEVLLGCYLVFLVELHHQLLLLLTASLKNLLGSSHLQIPLPYVAVRFHNLLFRFRPL